MLAAKLSEDSQEAVKQLQNLRYPIMVSPKIDGIRCHCWEGKAYSRKNKLIPNNHVQEVLKDCMSGYDGELVVGSPTNPHCIDITKSGVMSQDGEPNFKLYLFDHYQSPFDKFEDRFRTLQVQTAVNRPAYIKLVPHEIASCYEELMNIEDRRVSQGFEGIMIRDPNGPYKEGRSTLREGWLIKIKRFVDGEAIITGAYEQETNLNESVINEVGKSKRSSHKENMMKNGHLGGFHVKDIETEIEFDLGGFLRVTKEQRKNMWKNFLGNPKLYIGKIVTYKHFPVGAKDKPRHPIMIGFRNLEID